VGQAISAAGIDMNADMSIFRLPQRYGKGEKPFSD
jgi:hypothetical protein